MDDPILLLRFLARLTPMIPRSWIRILIQIMTLFQVCDSRYGYDNFDDHD
jgi:hypothetical protein